MTEDWRNLQEQAQQYKGRYVTVDINQEEIARKVNEGKVDGRLTNIIDALGGLVPVQNGLPTTASHGTFYIKGNDTQGIIAASSAAVNPDIEIYVPFEYISGFLKR